MKIINIIIVIILFTVCASSTTVEYHSRIDMRNNNITNLADGVNDNDAVNYGQLSEASSNIDTTGTVTVGFWDNCTYKLDTDDTDHSDNLQAAFNDAHATKKSVKLMIGKYKIHSASVKIPAGLTVEGASWPFSGAHTNLFDSVQTGYNYYSTFYVDYTGGPAIKIEGGAELKRVAFNYSQNVYDAASWIVYPAAIKILSNLDASDPGSIQAGGIHLSEIYMRNPYIAINATAPHTALVCEDIYGAPINTGIYIGPGATGVAGSTEPDHLSRVHWNPAFMGDNICPDVVNTKLWNYIMDNGVGFNIHNADGIQLTNCFVYHYNMGYVFHGTNACPSITASNTDTCKLYAFYLEDCYGMNIINSVASTGNNSALSDVSSIGIMLAGNTSRCSFSNGFISSQGKGIYQTTTGTDWMGDAEWGNSFIGNTIRFNGGNGGSQIYGITIWDGNATRIEDNTLNGLGFSHSTGIAITGSVSYATVTKNTLMNMGDSGIYNDGVSGQCFGNLGVSVGSMDYSGSGTWGTNGDNVDI